MFIPDIHAPYYDEQALATALAFVRLYRPDIVFIMGDLVDFYQLSRFDREPRRALELQADLDSGRNVLRRIRSAAKAAKLYLIRGNHEYRLTRYLWSNAKELAGLRCLGLRDLLDLKALGVEYVDRGWMRFHEFLVKHGTLVRARSGYTATGELERAGISGVSGHTHRLAQVYRRTYAGMFTWIEAGCLCQLDPEYLDGAVSDWHPGLAYGHFERAANRFVAHTLPIVNGRIIYGGREVKG